MNIGVKPQLQIENGYYMAEIIEAEPYRGNWGACVSIMFRLLAGNQAGAKIRLVIPAMATGRNKTGRLILAAGLELANRSEISSSDLLGKKVVIRTQLVQGSSGYYSKVENVLPLDQTEGRAEMIIKP